MADGLSAWSRGFLPSEAVPQESGLRGPYAGADKRRRLSLSAFFAAGAVPVPWPLLLAGGIAETVAL